MEILSLICGLALFLYGMELMGDALKKSAGSNLKTYLGKMTSTPLKGFLLGLVVTGIIQSSSATTVMVVGFVNSGTMTLLQSVGVIMGANVGTAVTAWLTALSGVGGDSAGLAGAIGWLKPDSWVPILALIGICLVMFVKRGKKKDIGVILLGFTIIMTGMEMMSGSVGGLKDNPDFKNIFTMFENPLLGVLAGLILTAIVQSSSASVGILQSLTTTGAITYGAAIPIIMGQNIGTCVTAMISSVGANKNGKRAALIHLYFNIIGVVIWLSVFSIVNAIFKFAFVETAIDMWGVAFVHTIFKILSVLVMAPFYRQLEKLARLTIKDKGDEREVENLLDDLLLDTPGVAVARAAEVTETMATLACEALTKSLSLFDKYDPKLAETIRNLEEKGDMYEDALGSYLVKASAKPMNEADSKLVTKLLHVIGDFERISDHAVNILESAEELREKKIEFSERANGELRVMRLAVGDIVEKAKNAYINNDITLATEVEPLEQVVDDIRDKIKFNHTLRLQKSECTIEHGFVLGDLLTNFERVADHCSNIAGSVIEISTYNALDVHKYIANLKHGNEVFDERYDEYKRIYSIDE